jgi:murein L,D-transpeptidase YcbB/YkuD
MSRRRPRAAWAGPALALGSVAALVALVLALSGGGCDLVDASRRVVRERIRQQLTGARSAQRWFRRSRERALVGNYDVAPLVVRFYERRGFNAAWSTGRGPRDEALQLADALEAAPREGLEPGDAQAGQVRARLGLWPSAPEPLGPRPAPGTLAETDILLTRSFFKHAAHLQTGLLDPARLPSDWHLNPRHADLVKVLERALAEHDVAAALAGLEPPHAGYAALRALLARYREIAGAGGWPAVPPGRPLRRGSEGGRVRRLRERLAAEGDLDRSLSGGEVFDGALLAAVRRFQARHGLDPTGVVGEHEFVELDVPVEARIRQITLNLERWRWLPATLGERHLLVNIPGFALEAREHDRAVLAMRVVVGKELSRTPMFSDSITYLVFNPVWMLPIEIAKNEVLPAIQKDPEYLAKNHLRLYEGRGRSAREVDPATVDWQKVTPEEFGFAVRQDPGPENSIGHVKFMCPNQFSVYLHDTPAGRLFSATQRDYSHGCVRVERPLELALYLLRGKADWDSARIAAAFDTLKNQVVRLPEPVPVHILYWTTWVDDQGAAQFRRDVYGVDSLLTDALSRARSLPAPALEWARIRPRDSTSTALPQRAGAAPGPGAARATPAAPARR